jgi:ABC-type amino acid transport substrate-binding protein
VRPFETRPYERPEIALDAVRLGEADAALVDTISARRYAEVHPGWASVQHSVTHRGFVIATEVHRTETLRVTDRALANLLTEGLVSAIIDRWL